MAEKYLNSPPLPCQLHSCVQTSSDTLRQMRPILNTQPRLSPGENSVYYLLAGSDKYFKYLRLQFVASLCVFPSGFSPYGHPSEALQKVCLFCCFSVHFSKRRNKKLVLRCWYLFLDPFCNDGEWWRLLNSHMPHIHKEASPPKSCCSVPLLADRVVLKITSRLSASTR